DPIAVWRLRKRQHSSDLWKHLEWHRLKIHQTHPSPSKLHNDLRIVGAVRAPNLPGVRRVKLATSIHFSELDEIIRKLRVENSLIPRKVVDATIERCLRWLGDFLQLRNQVLMQVFPKPQPSSVCH